MAPLAIRLIICRDLSNDIFRRLFRKTPGINLYSRILVRTTVQVEASVSFRGILKPYISADRCLHESWHSLGLNENLVINIAQNRTSQSH